MILGHGGKRAPQADLVSCRVGLEVYEERRQGSHCLLLRARNLSALSDLANLPPFSLPPPLFCPPPPLLSQSLIANYTIRKTTRPVVPYSAAPSSVTPATPAPPTTTNVTTTNNSNSVPIFPALHLTPLNDTFNPKQISLYPIGSKIKIGRQTNAKTVPNGTNGYFDSKVLSRMHAEVWSEDGKVRRLFPCLVYSKPSSSVGTICLMSFSRLVTQ